MRILRNLLVLAVLAVASLGLTAGAASASLTCHLVASQTPQYVAGGLNWQVPYDYPTPEARTYCTGSGASIDHVKLLSQLFIGGCPSCYDNGYGYQLAYPADDWNHDEVWQFDTNGNSYDVSFYFYAVPHGGGPHFHLHFRSLCDGVPHWYGMRWFAYIYFKDGTNSGLLQSVDSGGVYQSC